MNSGGQAEDVVIDSALVSRLVAGQFPDWAHLPIRPVQSAGTDHDTFLMGDEWAVRLPRSRSAMRQVVKEQHWLPRLAPHLPLAIPTPEANGLPAYGYPWPWSVYRWLDGQDACAQPVEDARHAASLLGQFVGALQRIDATGGPPPGPHNFGRGVPLQARDAMTREAIEALAGVVDTAAAQEAWDTAVRAPEWEGPPVWLHGDLHPANLLVDGGQLSAVIDFGGLAVGDPACDLMVAWTYLSGHVRDTLRAALRPDEATWLRGQGWALSFGLVALPYYHETNPVLARIARHSIDEVLADR